MKNFHTTKLLEEYISRTKKNKKQFADNLGITFSLLSLLIRDEEEPPLELTYRLEKHSEQIIKACLWWKLVVKKQEFILSKDNEMKMLAYKKVKNSLRA